MKTLINIFFIIFINIFFLNKNVLSDDKIKLGLMVPLTGEYSFIGETIINSVRMAINKIDDERIVIIPKDTKSNPIDSLKVAKQLYDEGINIIIGPVFNESTKYLDELEDVIFISLTNKIKDKPANVISAGVNAISQINTIKKYVKLKDIERTIFLIPQTHFKNEIEFAIDKTKIKIKEKFIYDQEPTLITKQISKLTRYEQRKQNLENEIIKLENSNLTNKDKKISDLKKKDTLGFINFDSVIIADFDETLKSITTSLLYTDVSSKRIYYITLNQWFDETLLIDKSLQPIYFPSVNKENYDSFFKNYKKKFETNPNQLSFLSYDIVGLIYYLLYKNEFNLSKEIFYQKNKFKGKIGVFEIEKNIITHQLNFYEVSNGNFKKIF